MWPYWVLLGCVIAGLVSRPSDKTGQSWFGVWMRAKGFWK